MLSRVSRVHHIVSLRKLYAPGRAGLRGSRRCRERSDQRRAVRELSKTAGRVGALGVEMVAESLEAQIVKAARATGNPQRVPCSYELISTVQSMSISERRESRTEQYFVTDSSIARSACSFPIPVPLIRKFMVMCLYRRGIVSTRSPTTSISRDEIGVRCLARMSITS